MAAQNANIAHRGSFAQLSRFRKKKINSVELDQSLDVTNVSYMGTKNSAIFPVDSCSLVDG